MKGTCTFEGCEAEVICKGLCWSHYKQQLKGKELKPRLREIRRDAEGKECRSCKTYKKYEEFYANPNTKDGRQTLCKPCHIERVRSREKERAAKQVASAT